jgi:hypothetical protein
MSDMRFNARLDTSHHGPPRPFWDAAGAVAASTMRCASSLSTGAAYTRVFRCTHIWRGAWRPCSGFSCLYRPVMLLRTSRTARLSECQLNRSWQYTFSYNFIQIKCVPDTCSAYSSCYATTRRWVDTPGNGSINTFPEQRIDMQQ